MHSTPEPFTYIYALCDPDTGEIRYVGKANDPQVRLRRHLRPQELNADTYKSRWIRSLLACGKKPSLVVIDTVTITTWQKAERRWIADLRARGARLTNTYDGGYGRQAGLKHSPEVIEKIRRGLIGRPVSQETRGKLRERFAGKPLTEEHRQKLSEVHKERWAQVDPEEREETLRHLRHGWSEESRKKVSQTRLGKKRGKNTTSQYHGVSFFRRDGRWRAYIVHEGRQIHLGYFGTEVEAALAYDDAARSLLGDRAARVLNFPVDKEMQRDHN